MASARPRVSIVVPAYNMEGYVAESLRSVAAQSYASYECIVVDDGSTDATRGRVEPFLSDPRFKCVSHENRGVASARNTGIKESTGKFVAFLDADDLWLPGMLETRLRLFDECPEANLVFTNYVCFDESGEKRPLYSRQRPPVHGDIRRAVCEKNPFCIVTVMMPRELLVRLGGFTDGIRFVEEWDLYLRAAQQIGIYANGTMEILAKVRSRPGSLSKHRYSMYAARVEVLKAALARETDLDCRAIMERRYREDLCWMACHNLVRQARDSLPGSPNAAACALFRAWRLQPRRIRWAVMGLRLVVAGSRAGKTVNAVHSELKKRCLG